MKLRLFQMLHVSKSPCRVLAGCVLAALFAGPLRGAPLAHWSFDALDADGTFHDSVGNAHPATPKAPSAIQLQDSVDPLRLGKAVVFSGDPNSYLTIPPLTTLQKSSFSVAAWVSLDTPGPNVIISDWPNNARAVFAFGVNPVSNLPQAEPFADLASGETVGGRSNNRNRLFVARQPISTQSVPLNEWHHMAWTWDHDNRTLKTYLDGKLIEFTPGRQSNMSRQPDLAPPGAMMRIGSREMPASRSSDPVNFHGMLDELWIFDHVLSPIQIGNLIKTNNISGVGEPVIAAVGKPTAKPAATDALAAAAAPAVAPTPTLEPNPAPTATTAPIPAPAVAPELTPTTEPAPTPARISPVPETRASTPSVRPTPPRTLAPAPSLVPDSRPRIPVLGTTQNYPPARLAGIVACLTVIVTLSCYLIWAMTERARLRAAGRM